MHPVRTLTAIALAIAASPVWGLPAEASATPLVNESHCVVEVIDQKPDGEFVTSLQICFESLAAALAFGSGHQLTPGELSHVSGPALVASPDSGTLLTTFTLGTHFDGANGTGSSISVVGGSCTGGYWNTGASWANRITSSWNGCYRLRHYDDPNKTGMWADTIGIGQTDNLPGVMNNRTESVAYYGS